MTIGNLRKYNSIKSEFDGSNLTNGVYFYRIETERFSITKKMLMIK